MKCESERWMHFFQFSKWRSNVGSLLTIWLTCIAAQHYFCFLIVTYVLINFSVGSLLIKLWFRLIGVPRMMHLLFTLFTPTYMLTISLKKAFVIGVEWAKCMDIPYHISYLVHNDQWCVLQKFDSVDRFSFFIS